MWIFYGPLSSVCNPFTTQGNVVQGQMFTKTCACIHIGKSMYMHEEGAISFIHGIHICIIIMSVLTLLISGIYWHRKRRGADSRGPPDGNEERRMADEDTEQGTEESLPAESAVDFEVLCMCSSYTAAAFTYHLSL